MRARAINFCRDTVFRKLKMPGINNSYVSEEEGSFPTSVIYSVITECSLFSLPRRAYGGEMYARDLTALPLNEIVNVHFVIEAHSPRIPPQVRCHVRCKDRRIHARN